MRLANGIVIDKEKTFGVLKFSALRREWSRSVPNLSGKLKRGSLRYGEAVELADALGYDIVWQKR